MSKPELEKVGRSYFWNLVYGKEYSLYTRGATEKIPATFLGVMEGEGIFCREFIKGCVSVYKSDIRPKAIWYGDAGDDEPCVPLVPASFEGIIKNERLEKYLLDVLAGRKPEF